MENSFNDYVVNTIRVWNDLNEYLNKINNKEEKFNKEYYLDLLGDFIYNIEQSRITIHKDDTIENKDLTWCNTGLDVIVMTVSTHVEFGMEQGISSEEIMETIRNSKLPIKELNEICIKLNLDKDELLDNLSNLSSKELKDSYIKLLQGACKFLDASKKVLETNIPINVFNVLVGDLTHTESYIK